MKISLLLLTAFAAIPVYAGNLKYDDWSVNTDFGGGDYAVDEDGILSLNNVALAYVPETFKMQDGSSLSITLTFDPTSINNNVIFAFSPYATGMDYSDTIHALTGITGIYGSPYIESTNITGGNNSSNFSIPLALSQVPAESTLALNFYVEKDDLNFTYTLNDVQSQIWTVDVDTKLNWKPLLAVQGTTVKVTEMSLVPASSPVAPEPTTATLSLLALAGLAARRRRASR
ncbi:MAG: hypothetical protein IJN29_06965 [Akkermansia sp.]|nr:hypothetical protein [Akkermansia sp.]